MQRAPKIRWLIETSPPGNLSPEQSLWDMGALFVHLPSPGVSLESSSDLLFLFNKGVQRSQWELAALDSRSCQRQRGPPCGRHSLCVGNRVWCEHRHCWFCGRLCPGRGWPQSNRGGCRRSHEAGQGSQVSERKTSQAPPCQQTRGSGRLGRPWTATSCRVRSQTFPALNFLAGLCFETSSHNSL